MGFSGGVKRKSGRSSECSMVILEGLPYSILCGTPRCTFIMTIPVNFFSFKSRSTSESDRENGRVLAAGISFPKQFVIHRPVAVGAEALGLRLCVQQGLHSAQAQAAA